jgi:hypothetical protein
MNLISGPFSLAQRLMSLSEIKSMRAFVNLEYTAIPSLARTHGSINALAVGEKRRERTE